jgi:hypothetical protein
MDTLTCWIGTDKRPNTLEVNVNRNIMYLIYAGDIAAAFNLFSVDNEGKSILFIKSNELVFYHENETNGLHKGGLFSYRYEHDDCYEMLTQTPDFLKYSIEEIVNGRFSDEEVVQFIADANNYIEFVHENLAYMHVTWRPLNKKA